MSLAQDTRYDLYDANGVHLPDRLFHGTSIYNLAKIISENRLNEGIYKGLFGEPKGPRFSATFSIANEFVTYSATEYHKGGVIELNVQALLAQYDILAFEDRYSDGKLMPFEDEFGVITPSIGNLNAFLNAIHCSACDIEWAMDPVNMAYAQEMGGFPFKSNNGREEVGVLEDRYLIDYLQGLLEMLYRHPKRTELDNDMALSSFAP